MNTELNTNTEATTEVEIDATELETLAAGLPVRSNVHAGRSITPCV